MYNNTANVNTAFGAEALGSNINGGSNTAIGYNNLNDNVSGIGNTSIGSSTQSGDFSNSVIIGRGATATASNQFVIGSTTYNAGAVTTETPAATNRTWTVRINGANYKIPLIAI